MLKPEQIPDEVMLAAREAYMRGGAHISTNMRAAIAAALNAWPGMFENPAGDYLLMKRNALILPLPPQEK